MKTEESFYTNKHHRQANDITYILDGFSSSLFPVWMESTFSINTNYWNKDTTARVRCFILVILRIYEIFLSSFLLLFLIEICIILLS